MGPTQLMQSTIGSVIYRDLDKLNYRVSNLFFLIAVGLAFLLIYRGMAGYV